MNVTGREIVERYFEVFIPLEPKSKRRHRSGKTRTGKTVQFKDDKALKDERDTCAFIDRQKGVDSWSGLKHEFPLSTNTPVCLEIRFQLGIPASWAPAKRSAAILGGIMPTGKPDLDNLEKHILDCLILSRVLADDSCVVEISSRKVYATTPGTYIKVMWTC